MRDLRNKLLMNSIKNLLLIVFLCVFAVHAQNKPNMIDDNKVVAAIDKDFLVTLKDLKQYIVDWKYQRRFSVKSDIFKNALNDMIADRLRVFELFDRGLHENQDLMKKIRLNINIALMDAFFDKNFIEKYANEKTAAEAYKEIDKEIECSDIVIPIPAQPTKENLDSLRTIALKIETGLGRNDNIEKLIKPYSLKNLKINNKRKVTWPETMIDPVADVIFKLQKGFTRIIESMDGFHIVKVLDIKKIKVESFDKMKDKIVSELQKRYYDAYNNAYEDFRRGLIDKSAIKWNQGGLDQIVKWSSENSRFYAAAYKDTISNAILNGNNFNILSYDNVNVDLKEYLRLLEEVVILNPNTLLNSDNVKDFVLEALYDNNVVIAAKKLGLEDKLVTPYTQNTIIADRLLYLYKQGVIEEGLPKATPKALYQFYTDHKDSIFYQLKLVYIYARIYSDSSKAAADINEIRKGTPFENVSNTWSVHMYIRERDGTLKAYRTACGDYLAKAAFELDLSESAGPIAYYDSIKGKQFAVIKCLKIQPEKQLTYDDVKGARINDEFNNYYRRMISDEVDAVIRKKHKVEIFENILSEAIAAQ